MHCYIFSKKQFYQDGITISLDGWGNRVLVNSQGYTTFVRIGLIPQNSEKGKGVELTFID